MENMSEGLSQRCQLEKQYAAYPTHILFTMHDLTRFFFAWLEDCTSDSAVVIECTTTMAIYRAMAMHTKTYWKNYARQSWQDERIALAADNSLLIDGWVYVCMLSHDIFHVYTCACVFVILSKPTWQQGNRPQRPY